MMCSGLALSPAISIKMRGMAEAVSRATIATCGLLASQNNATGTAITAMTAIVVKPMASGQSNSAIAVRRKSSGVGLGMDATEEPIFIQIFELVFPTLP